ncbi:MAG: magnesium protoporphyrin IX methyltransferase [Cyanophyceae cyanobacterium]
MSTTAPAPESKEESQDNSPNNAQDSNDKTVVRDYFNSTGFDRWRRIYGEGDDINKVQRDIRTGHQRTIDLVVDWFEADKKAAEEAKGESGKSFGDRSVCDAGCGVGALAIPLAQQGVTVYASDISEKMVGEAIARAEALELDKQPTFETRDLEAIEGNYDSVICLDVLIHYPDEEMEAMLTHLANRADSRLILSFAPKTCFYATLKRIGEFFPGPSKATRAYLHREKEVVAILNKLGWEVARSEFTATRFYFSRLMEFVKAEATGEEKAEAA